MDSEGQSVVVRNLRQRLDLLLTPGITRKLCCIWLQVFAAHRILVCENPHGENPSHGRCSPHLTPREDCDIR